MAKSTVEQLFDAYAVVSRLSRKHQVKLIARLQADMSEKGKIPKLGRQKPEKEQVKPT